MSEEIRDPLTERIIGLGIEVHRALGPGLLESVYEECLCFEMSEHAIDFARQAPIPITYKNVRLDCGYRLDAVVERTLILEIKSVEKLLPLHEAQLLTYMKLGGIKKGLLMNFNVTLLKHGIKRFVI